jgi:tRNA(Ile)-lysidine synthase
VEKNLVRREGVEAAARQARYEALVSAARKLGAAAVAVAHTRDDQVETVLLGMARSSSPMAMAGMPRSFDRNGVCFLRPFLDLSRDDTTQICQQNHIEWWDDPTNTPGRVDGGAGAGGAEASFPLRSRVRQQLVPVLREVAGDAVMDHIAAMAESARKDQDFLEEQARTAIERVCLDADGTGTDDGTDSAGSAGNRRAASGGRGVLLERLDADALAQVPEPLRVRVERIVLERHGVAPTRALLERIDALATDWHGQSQVRISSGFSVMRQGHVIELCQDRTHANS